MTEETSAPTPGSDLPEIPRQSPLLPLLIAALVTALLMGPILFMRIVAPRPSWVLLPWFCFFVALEGALTTRWLARPNRRNLNRFSYRLAELVFIALVARLLTWIAGPGFPTLAEWRGYLTAPFSFLDLAWTIYLFLGFVAWERGNTFSRLFVGLSLTQAEIDYYAKPVRERTIRSDDRPLTLRRTQVFHQLVQSWVSGGLILAVVAAGTTIDTTSLSTTTLRTVGRLGLRPEILVALLVYFLLGLVLVSQGRLMVLRIRWLVNGIEADEGMVRTWHRASLLLIGVTALVAAFLPIGSTFGAARLLQAISVVAGAIFSFIFLIFFTLLSLLASLLGLQVDEVEPVDPSVIPPEPPPPLPGTMSETPSLIAGGLFWIVVAVVTMVAVVFFLRERNVTLNLAFLRTWWAGLVTWWHNLRRGVSGRVATITHSVRTRLRIAEEDAEKSPWRFLRVGSLSPREQIRFFYLAMARRARESGVAREQGETPSEYAQDLKEGWPDAETEIEYLTGAFLEARYSAHPIDDEDVDPVKHKWRQVRADLRKRGDRRDADADSRRR